MGSRVLLPRPATGSGDAALTRRSTVAVAVAAGVALGVVASVLKVADGSHSPLDTVASALSGSLFLAAGWVAHLRRPVNGTGLLMVLVGVAYFAEDLQLATNPLLFTAGLLVTNVSAPVIVHLVLAFPYGRLGSRTLRTLCVIPYVTVAVFSVVGALFVDWAAHYPGKPANLLLVVDSTTVAVVAGTAFQVLATMVAVGVVVSLALRFAKSGPHLRASFAPVLSIAVVTGLASAVGSAAGPHNTVNLVALVVYKIGLCLWPVAFLVGVLLARPGRTAVADLLAVSRVPTNVVELRDLLAATLRDPTLRLGQWRPDEGTFVDTDGRPFDPAESDDHTVVTLDDETGQPIGALVHGNSPWANPLTLEAVAAVVALMLAKQRLTAEVHAQLAELQESRTRLVSLADAERRRLERDLHDGAQQRLVTVALGIRLARDQVPPDGDPELTALLSAAADGVAAAIAELRELAKGIHPALLTEAGLVPAVADLVDRTPLRVRLRAPEVARLPAPVEVTAYFVVAEALTNALKHARASVAEVRLSADGDRLRIEVVDDGVGGADPAVGSGLSGLRERVRALGGELTVGSAGQRGTAVAADIPTTGVHDG